MPISSSSSSRHHSGSPSLSSSKPSGPGPLREGAPPDPARPSSSPHPPRSPRSSKSNLRRRSPCSRQPAERGPPSGQAKGDMNIGSRVSVRPRAACPAPPGGSPGLAERQRSASRRGAAPSLQLPSSPPSCSSRRERQFSLSERACSFRGPAPLSSKLERAARETYSNSHPHPIPGRTKLCTGPSQAPLPPSLRTGFSNLLSPLQEENGTSKPAPQCTGLHKYLGHGGPGWT